MNYLDINFEDVRKLAYQHGSDDLEFFDFDDNTIPIWASNNYQGCIGAPEDVNGLCDHACLAMGTYIKGEISPEVYLSAMQNIDRMLRRYYGTSLEKEWPR